MGPFRFLGLLIPFSAVTQEKKGLEAKLGKGLTCFLSLLATSSCSKGCNEQRQGAESEAMGLRDSNSKDTNQTNLHADNVRSRMLVLSSPCGTVANVQHCFAAFHTH